MGILFSRFRKKKTTIEVLENLDTKIKEIQQYGQTTEQRHKKIVGTLIIWSVALYIIAAMVFYFYFFPASLRDRFFYITPLLIFPLLVILTKRMVTWYYNRKISRNRDKLTNMQEEKKKILDEVTETETYKKAKEILMKFAPDQLRMTPLSPQPPYKVTPVESPRRPSTPQAVVAPLPGGSELRRRALTVSNPSSNMSASRQTISGLAPIGVAPVITPQRQSPHQMGVRSFNAATIGPRSPLPRPILPQQRSYLDRLVEYLVGDGPSNRYALICQMCESHNGMALKEEFEFFGFRCCYCNFWNPARKQKPSAPKLEQTPSSPQSILQSPKNSEADVSSVSSGSVTRTSEIPNPSMSLCIKVPTEPNYYETLTTLPVQKSSFMKYDDSRQRRTIHDIKYWEAFGHYQNHVLETNSISCDVQNSKKILRGQRGKQDSDIEVMEKPSDQSGNETDKDSNAGTEEAASSNVDEGRQSILARYMKDSRVVLPSHRRTRLNNSIINAERIKRGSEKFEHEERAMEEENPAVKEQNEKMEVDESPKK